MTDTVTKLHREIGQLRMALCLLADAARAVLREIPPEDRIRVWLSDAQVEVLDALAEAVTRAGEVDR